MVIAGMMVRAPILQENEDDDNDQDDGFEKRAQHVADRFAYRVRRVEGELVLHPRRKALGQAVQLGNRLAVYFQSVGIRKLRDAEADGVVSVELQVGAVILGAEFRASDVLTRTSVPSILVFRMMLSNCAGFRQSANGAHADLVVLPRL